MSLTILFRPSVTVSFAFMLLSACSTPTLVEIARRRQATPDELKSGRGVKDDVRIQYTVTDWDVLNFTDEVKRKLANRSSLHLGFAYGTSATQATLGALAGAAQIFGWGLSAASGLGLGATYVFGMGKIFDSKGHAQAYEQAFTAIQAAEATYYFHQLGMGFDKLTGRVLTGNLNGRSGIPSQTNLTPDGETLYYRVSKILRVLSDTLSSKIPDLQDLKEANGESTASGPPAIPAHAQAEVTPSNTTGNVRKNTGEVAQEIIPPALRARNALLESAFKALSEEDAKKRLHDKGLFAPEGTAAKEYLAKVILARSDLPLLPNRTAIESLTYYRSHASDEASTANLEAAYRDFSLLPPA